jgi:Ca2+-binding EF-hand superfamily protein
MDFLTDDEIRRLFHILDEDENRSISVREFAGLMISIPFTPGYDTPLPDFILNGILNGNIEDERLHLAPYFRAFDSDGSGELDINEFGNMIRGAWHQNFQRRIKNYLNIDIPVLPAVPRVVQQPVRTSADIAGISFNSDTPIAGQVTLRELTNNLRQLTDEQIALAPGKGRPVVAEIQRYKRLGRLHEIHAEILRFANFDRCLDNLVIIAGSDYNPRLNPLDQLIIDFRNFLVRGIDVIISGRMGRIEQPGLTREGLIMFMNYVLTDPQVGMQAYIGTHLLAGKSNWSFARCVYLVNRFLSSFNRFGTRVDDIAIGSYTLRYLNWCVGGYDHTLETWIRDQGRPLFNIDDNAPHYYSARCGGGLADCVVYALHNSIPTMIERISSLLPASQPPPILRQGNQDEVVPIEPNAMSVENYEAALITTIQDLMSDGLDYDTAMAMAISQLGERPSESARPSESVLPPNWLKVVYETRTIYVNVSTGETSFEPPVPARRSTDIPPPAPARPSRDMPPPAPVRIIQRSSEEILRQLPIELRHVVEQQESNSNAPQSVKEHRALLALNYFRDATPADLAYIMAVSQLTTPRATQNSQSPRILAQSSQSSNGSAAVPVHPSGRQTHFKPISTTADVDTIRNLIRQHDLAYNAATNNSNANTIAEEARLARSIAEYFPEWDQRVQHTDQILQQTNARLNEIFYQYRMAELPSKSLNGFKVLLVEEALKTYFGRQEDIHFLNEALQQFANSLYGPHFIGESFIEAFNLTDPSSYNPSRNSGEGGKFTNSKKRLSKKKYNINKKSKNNNKNSKNNNRKSKNNNRKILTKYLYI